MPTKAIGTGTRNAAFNAPKEWLELLGQLAGCGNVGKFVREKVEAGIERENPEAARKLREIRRQYYGAGLVVLFIGGIIASLLAHDELNLRRCSRSGRRTRTEEFEIEEAASC